MHLPRVLAVCVALLPVACGKTQATSAPRTGPPPLRVRVAAVKLQDVVYQVKALGSLEADEMVRVPAQVEGAVAEVRFQAGDRVTPDTVLLRIDPERHRLEAERAEAQYRTALAEQSRSERDLARREALALDQLVSAEELNRSRGEAERLSAAAAAAKAARDLAKENLRRSDVRAPRAGVVNTRTVETGQFVKEGDVLATLADTSRLRLRFKVSDAESLQAKEGDTVTFRIGALGEESFPARIYHVSDVADPTTRQVEVLAWVKNPGVLKPGFFAEVTLATASKQGALVVPEGAIQASERGFIAYAVEDGKARAKPVQIGLRTGTGVVEILAGVAAGETVVVEGSDRIGDGVPVQAAP
ncbi:MAG TPA: efflux RND transporter periplasmic adaptor subunit [Vicinamibacteria bacterium]|nr:efflux RND transporter periplasmic adaptor subunit [Vicinamibacteria bacterium]